MRHAIGTTLLWIVGIVLAVFLAMAVCAFAGIIWAGWALGAVMLSAKPVLVFLALCLLGGLELRFPAKNYSSKGKLLLVLSFVSTAAGVLLGVASRVALNTISAYSASLMLYLSLGLIWFGVFLLRRSSINLFGKSAAKAVAP